MQRFLRRVRPYAALFLGLSVVYHSNFRPVDSSDTLGAALTPLALVLDHTICLDRFGPWLADHFPYTRGALRQTHGHYFSSYPIGGPLLVSPLYLPLAWAGNIRSWPPGALVALARILEKFSAALLAALSAVLLLLLLQRITTPGWAWTLTLVYALGTSTWSISSQAMWQHGPAELSLIGALLFLERWVDGRSSRWLWMCGACAGYALLARHTNVVLLPALAVALWRSQARPAQYARMLALPLAAGLAALVYNLYVFDQASGSQPVEGLQGSLGPGLAGIFFSPARGLLIYTPVVAFAVCALLPPAAALRRKHAAMPAACLLFIALHCLIIARWMDWKGGYCWGPRLLSEIAPPLIILIALGASLISVPWTRCGFVVLALYSIFMQAVGVYFYPNGHWDFEPVPASQAPYRLWDWTDNPLRRTLAAGPVWEPYVVVGAALTGGIPAAARKMRELNANPYASE